MKTYIFICSGGKSILFDKQMVGEHSLLFKICTDSSHNMHALMIGYWPVTITSLTVAYRVTYNPICIPLLESVRYVTVDLFSTYVHILLFYV
jgi:hypothetical protein